MVAGEIVEFMRRDRFMEQGDDGAQRLGQLAAFVAGDQMSFDASSVRSPFGNGPRVRISNTWSQFRKVFMVGLTRTVLIGGEMFCDL